MEKQTKKTEKKDFQQVLQVEHTPFTILKDLEKGDYIIVMGNAVATHKRYENLQDAIRDIKKINWDLIATFFLKMQHYSNEQNVKQNEEIQEEDNNIENYNQKTN